MEFEDWVFCAAYVRWKAAGTTKAVGNKVEGTGKDFVKQINVTRQEQNQQNQMPLITKLWRVCVFTCWVLFFLSCSSEHVTWLSSSGLRTAGWEGAERTRDDSQPLLSSNVVFLWPMTVLTFSAEDLWHDLQQLQFKVKGKSLAKPSCNSVFRSVHVSRDSHFWSYEG